MLRCYVTVTDDVTRHRPIAAVKKLRCTPYEPVTVMSLRLVADDDIDKQRVHRKLCELLRPEVTSCEAIVVQDVEGGKAAATGAVQTGSRNLADLRHMADVWWPIACASDSFGAGLFESVRRDADRGRLSELLGVGVQMWSIGNRDDAMVKFVAGSLLRSNGMSLVGVWLMFGWCLVGVWLVFGWCLVGSLG